ncbi:YcxB family protein [Paenibacillus harenae]|uniref:Zn-dependent protease with chaperone function n=1 Tax=Paenibacillus harenae TaxID=306543 RepID=A0ABT9TYL2_PAEHA|nr:YcxB family protein [Paenibacillus harenae]MDQ0112431.1 Zn-dependent protease with chaperone function [Paenibacillus harenae]
MDSSNNLVFDIQLSQKDYSYLIIQHQRKTIIAGFLFYFLVFFLVVLGVNQFQLDIDIVLVGFIGGIVISLIISLVSYFLLIFQSNRTFRSDKLLQSNQTYTISNLGIEIESISGKGLISWNDIFKVVESKLIIAIYIGRNRALILPKEDINTKRIDGINILKEYITNYVPKNKVKLV